MKEFFGFGGYNRDPEGFMSIEHILFVSFGIIVMIALSIILGLKYKNREDKNKVLVVSAILIDSFEIFKIIILCFRVSNFSPIIYNLPLFLCSIQLITIPLAAFSKGIVKEASLDFVFMFGILGALLGTYGAGNNYSSYPVLSFDNTISLITHSISGFASLYIGISGLSSMKKNNMFISYSILIMFCVLAYIADIIIPYNYMFLIRGDGTPYDILYNLLNGNKVLYPLFVVLLFILYISVFYFVLFMIRKRKKI